MTELDIRVVLDEWVLCRDNGHWQDLRACFSSAGQMTTVGPTVSADAYIAATRSSLERGTRTQHLTGPSRIRINAGRALAQTQATVNIQTQAHGREVDIVALVRYLDRLLFEDGRWGILDRRPVYLSDRMEPSRADVWLPLDDELLTMCPDGARSLVYLELAAGGNVPVPAPVAFDTPRAEALIAAAEVWLTGDPR